MDKLDVVCVEIGSRGHLSRADARRGAVTWKRAQRAQPGARFIFTIAGYDDPRALWEIPEVAAYVRRWAELACASVARAIEAAAAALSAGAAVH